MSCHIQLPAARKSAAAIDHFGAISGQFRGNFGAISGQWRNRTLMGRSESANQLGAIKRRQKRPIEPIISIIVLGNAVDRIPSIIHRHLSEICK